MKRILFAVDLTEPPEATVQVESLAQKLGAELLVAHVCPDPGTAGLVAPVDPTTGMGGFSYTLIDPSLSEKVFEAEGEAFGRFLRERFSTPVKATLLRGDADTALLDAAEEFGADLVVLGKRHRGALEKLLVGSVASAVVEQCGCPTLLIPVPEV